VAAPGRNFFRGLLTNLFGGGQTPIGKSATQDDVTRLLQITAEESLFQEYAQGQSFESCQIPTF
jgi:hypothetical protein